MPKITFTDRSQVPEGLDVAEVDGKFVVEVVNKSKLDEFRDTNINITKERDSLKAYRDSVADIVGDDAAAFKATYTDLAATAQKVKDGTLKGTDAITAEVEARTKSMREDFERQLVSKANEARTATENARSWEDKHKRSLIDSAITKAAINPESGVETTALPDIMTRAYGVFKVQDNGSVVPMDGEAVIYGNDGATPMTPDEWVASLKKQAPHFFKRSAGGGSEGGANKGLGGMSPEAISKLSPAQKMELARKAGR